MSLGYLLDTNVFIEAKNRYYGFDIVPSFWEWLDRRQSSHEIASILPVYDELAQGNDDLSDWVKARKASGWWLDVADQEIQESYGEIVTWVMSQGFTQAAKDEFLTGADPWLIAKARALGVKVVTHEQLDLNAKRKVFIPVVCKHFGVAYLDTFELIRSFGDSLGT